MSIEKMNDTEGNNERPPFAMVANQVVQSVRNPDALAIWTYLQSLPSKWVIRRGQLMEHFGLGRDRYSKAFKDLRDAGLVTVTPEQEEGTGKMLGQKVTVHWKPYVLFSVETDIRPYGEPTAYKENTSTKEVDLKEKHPLPNTGKQKRERKEEVTLPVYLEGRKGEVIIPEDHGARIFAKNAGIPEEFVKLAWSRFVKVHADSGKRYKDWGITFRNAVMGNWMDIWYWSKEGEYRLTTVGMQVQNALNGSQQVAR